MKKNKERLDTILLNKGFVSDISYAQALILAKKVKVNGLFVTQAGLRFDENIQIELKPEKKYVSRGGIKLEHALQQSKLNINDKRCLDIGVSTGGFTDCLLQAGASKVYAVDVGYGQTADKIRNHDKVELLERTNARSMNKLNEPIDILTVDVSFISILKIIPNILSSLNNHSEVLALIKPQFELPKHLVDQGGVVKSHLLHASAVARIVVKLLNYNLYYKQLIQSPLLGADGNREFFVWMCHEK